MNKLLACTLAAAALAAAPSISSAADAATRVAALPTALACQGSPAMSELQKRVVGKANQGTDALRNFVSITRGIYALDMTELAGWLDEQRAAQGSCVAVASNATR